MNRRELLMTAAATVVASALPARGTTPLPNVVHILVDDATRAVIENMPRVQADIRGVGTYFKNCWTPMPECSPNRACFFTGVAPHNSGITSNVAYDYYVSSGLDAASIHAMLHDAGNFVAFVGKHLNDNPLNSPLPAGVDFGAVLQGNAISEHYSNFNVMTNSGLVTYDSGEYVTDVLSDYAQDAITAALGSGKRWAIYIHTNAPHSPAVPASGDTSFTPDQMPTDPPFNTQVTGDIARDPLSDDDVAFDRNIWAAQNNCVQAVDRLIGAVIDRLSDEGILSNTIIFFSSDNGVCYGQDRIANAKVVPYPTATRLPLYVRGPNINHAGLVVPVSSLDVYATMVDLFGLTSPRPMDGRSLVPAFTGTITGRPTAQLLYFTSGWGIATQNYLYVDRNSGIDLLFNLKSDSNCLANVISDSSYASALSELQTDLATLKTASGIVITHTYPPPPL